MSTAIRTAIVALLKTVPGIGEVHDRERYSATDKDLRALYGVDRLRGWHVVRVGRRESADFSVVETDWEIRGFMAFDDRSQSGLAFDGLIDAIVDAWRADPKLGDLVMWPQDGQPIVPSLTDAGPVMFAGVLCHSCRLKHTTRHRLDLPGRWD